MKSGSEWFESVSTSLKWNTRGAAQKGWDGLEENEEQAMSGTLILTILRTAQAKIAAIVLALPKGHELARGLELSTYCNAFIPCWSLGS